MQNYEFLIKKIASYSGLSIEEIERKIEAKRAKLSGLISKEGAAQIIASELGISFDNLDLKIIELMPGMKKINLLAKVVKVFPVRNFKKGEREGKVLNLIIADDSGSTRAVLWDTNHISLFEKNELKEGDVIEIKNASVRDSEVHLSGFSDIKKSSFVFDEVKLFSDFVEKKLSEVKERDSVITRGCVVQIFSPRFFSVCSKCNKKVVQTEEGHFCDEHGLTTPKERAILTIIIDDGTDNVRTVLFSDTISEIASEEELKDDAQFLRLKERVLGTEIEVKGYVRKNVLSNSFEIFAREVKIVNPEDIINKFS
ncbi:MAG: hypothetical protein QW273_01875 [Candidatus Pacearchaeota archaeon]